MEKENLDNGIKPDVIGLAVKGAAVREIKFRAWDKENKRIIDLSKREQWGFINGDIQLCQGANSLLLNPNSFDFMQFTGLKDKNGKEIYEGDIVMCLSELRENPFIDFIRYDESFCGFTSDKHGSHIMQKSNETFWLEVIGNIYENVGLLPPLTACR